MKREHYLFSCISCWIYILCVCLLFTYAFSFYVWHALTLTRWTFPDLQILGHSCLKPGNKNLKSFLIENGWARAPFGWMLRAGLRNLNKETKKLRKNKAKIQMELHFYVVYDLLYMFFFYIAFSKGTLQPLATLESYFARILLLEWSALSRKKAVCERTTLLYQQGTLHLCKEHNLFLRNAVC